MKEITAFALTITPIRVWTYIADLAAFALWHPTYRFRGVATPHAEVGLTFGMLKGELPLSTEARIVAYDRAQRFAWRIGLGGVFTLSEEYALEEAGPQTRVRHTVTIEGALSPLSYLVRRRLRRSMRTQDAALVRYLTREVRGSSFTINRHRRRARKAQPPRKAAND
ncbi:SRPBCC family protein [Erythrobacter cryptus]|uniref:SRPBCC family protein n=1 Tax=Erythrobacter cryptus TaxID=196588 RepID=UPI0004815585|nr:SRPBCC family protein [Erythrobacter cryptus]